MERKYFFFDIDGTLAAGEMRNQFIPESTKRALEELRAAGHFVAIATGRSYAMAVDHMRDMGFSNMVSDGGKGIKPMDYEKCVALIEECERKGFIWAFSPENSKRRLAPDNRFHEFTRDVYMETEVVPGLNPRDYKEIYKIYIACFPPEEEKLKTLGELPWCRFFKEFLFVEPADKSVGIKAMVDRLGGDYKDVVVFGDEKNDISMFRKEWTSIAMGNAIEELKRLADYVTDDCDKDGIYNACRHFGWI